MQYSDDGKQIGYWKVPFLLLLSHKVPNRSQPNEKNLFFLNYFTLERTDLHQFLYHSPSLIIEPNSTMSKFEWIRFLGFYPITLLPGKTRKTMKVTSCTSDSGYIHQECPECLKAWWNVLAVVYGNFFCSRLKQTTKILKWKSRLSQNNF